MILLYCYKKKELNSTAHAVTPDCEGPATDERTGFRTDLLFARAT